VKCDTAVEEDATKHFGESTFRVSAVEGQETRHKDHEIVRPEVPN
jgi:hypothetical protein